MTNKSIFNNRFDRLKKSIESYLNEINYDLVDFEIDEIIGQHDWGNERKIYPNDKCPLDIKNAIADILKKEFPNPSEIR